ncbi:MAG: hypothetical protein U9Q20_02405 [Campylobacterota bacterium]|nr:hypothetical protein [Campylobacterota bacterium]
MESLGLLLIFWYGILHAFAPDHLTAIADFSIGKSKRKTFLITFAFAFGHGVMLFIFAKILDYYPISDHILEYGNTISALVIFFMGVFILYMVFTNQIQLKIHKHNGAEHIHIWYGKKHKHNNRSSYNALAIGALMGLGGVRGMLVTLGLIEAKSVDFTMILMFVLGVSVVFFALGMMILYINQNLLHNIQNVRRVFTTVGVISIVVGATMFFTPHSHAVMFAPDIKGLEDHPHPHQNDTKYKNAEELVQSRQKADITYAQMMAGMGEALVMIQKGVLTQNTYLVKNGANILDNHPAPNHKPWSIMQKDDQRNFKETLLSYDLLLHEATSEILEVLDKKDWVAVNEKTFILSNHCVSCHSVWRGKVKK